MSLDPIVSLSVAIAEAPGSQAFLLGSGISREAGVPTGQQVFWQAVGELYRLENEIPDTPDRDGLAAWLDETRRGEFAYSEILELIAPDPANRRDYLAKHFEGKEPGVSHHELAALAEQELVRVFVTTNFDRLLEHALQARGIEPIIVTCAADLASAPRREHAQCYVVKPHGDYLQETIRNTPSELAELEPEMTHELSEIFDRYGVVVLGYSGSDPAISGLLGARCSRYGLYWVARGELGEGAKRIIERTGGRVIERDGAAEFLADLRRRLEVFRSQPSGHTPIEVYEEVLALVRAKNEIGLAEVMRRERREYGERMTTIIGEHRQEHPQEENLLRAHDQMLPVWERRLASLLPVIAYAPDSFQREVRSLIELMEGRPIEGGYTAWAELLDWATWWLGYVAGAFALAQEAWPALRPLLEAKYAEGNEWERHLVEPVRENISLEVGAFVMARFSNTKWLSPRWEHLIWSVSESSVLQERWPEFLQGERPKVLALTNFDFLVSMREALEDETAWAYWLIYPNGAVPFARRVRTDARYREAVADLLGVTPEEFFSRVGSALKQHSRMAAHGGFSSSGAISVLLADQDEND